MFYFYNLPKQKIYVTDKLYYLCLGSDFTNVPPTTTLIDRSGNGHDLTCQDFDYTETSGSDGNGAIVLDGTNDNIKRVTAVDYDGSTSITIEMRISNLPYNPESVKMFVESNWVSGILANGGYSIYFETTNLKISTMIGGGYCLNLYALDLSASVSKTLTIVINSSAISRNDVIKFYINGVIQAYTSGASTTNRNQVIANATNYMFSTVSSINFCPGKVYAIRLYTKELSQAEIDNNVQVDDATIKF